MMPTLAFKCNPPLLRDYISSGGGPVDIVYQAFKKAVFDFCKIASSPDDKTFLAAQMAEVRPALMAYQKFNAEEPGPISSDDIVSAVLFDKTFELNNYREINYPS